MTQKWRSAPQPTRRHWHLLTFPAAHVDGQPTTWRQPVVDVALIGGATVFGIFMLIPTAAMHSRFALAADIVIGVAACTVLVARRRWPAQIGTFAVAASAVSAMAAGASLVALFTAAIRVRLAILLALTTGELLATCCFPLLYPGAGDFSYVTQVTIGSLLNLAVVGWGLMVRAQRNYLRAVEDRAQDLESAQELLAASVRDHERRRIAREMHDALAHRLSLLSVHAGALELRPDLSQEQIRTMAGVIRDTSHHALEDLQDVIGLLRDNASLNSSLLKPHPGLADIAALVTEARQTGTRIELTQDVTEDRSTNRNHAASTSAYRIVQEGLTNARKHAPTSPVKIVLQSGGSGEIVVTVSTFIPPTPNTNPSIPGAGTGLRGLAERVSLVGGTFTSATIGNQFVVTGRLPWNK